ncbi:MAG TPA: anti-sigma factor [Verrucomicrobiae bacterium]|nr:anti-sigma factor [Verrucomicrobiae bacterium]
MVHEDNERLLNGYFDGELDLIRSVEFEEHLRTCPDCARQFHDQQAIRQRLREANLYERAPQSLRARIRAQLPREAQSKPAVKPRSPALEWLAIAAAIVIAVVLGTRVIIPNIRGHEQTNLLSQEIVASHIRSLQPGHLFDVQSTDQHTVKPWFDGKLDFAPPVVDLADHGFPLVGGRLDYLENRTVAVLVYGRKLHVINLFIWPASQESISPVPVETVQGYNVLSWKKNGFQFRAVSDLNVDELREFVRLATP